MDISAIPQGGDRDRGAVILGVTWTYTLLAAIVVGLRVYTRVKLVQKIWWDDGLAVLAIALASPLPIIWIFYVREGGARHLYYLSTEQRMQTIRINWMSQPFGIMAIAIAKSSVAFSILRFQSPNKWRTRVLYFISASVVVLSTLTSIFTFVQCNPARALWTAGLAATAKCWPPKIFTIWTIGVSGYSAAMDFILVFISTTIIWNLKLSLSRRLQLAVLLSTGILDGIFGIIKATTLTAQSARSDYTWNTYLLFIWTIAELHGIIIGSCLPTLRPLYLIVFRRPGREAYIAKRNQSYELEGSLPGSHNSRIRQAKRERTQSDESFIVPGIRHTVDMEVSFEPQGQAHHESTWPVKAGNVTSVYHPV